MTVHELTHTITNTMPVYPGTEQPVLTTACTIEKTGYRETLLHMYSHTGTHMDAPAHMIEGGKPLDAFPAEAFVGRGFVLDCRGQARYFEDFPCLTAEAAAFVASLPLKGVGEDCISLDPCDSVRFPNHMTLLGRNFLNTENLKDLDQLIGRPFTFVTLPLKFENADGCSCRAVAITEEE